MSRLSADVTGAVLKHRFLLASHRRATGGNLTELFADANRKNPGQPPRVCWFL